MLKFIMRLHIVPVAAFLALLVTLVTLAVFNSNEPSYARKKKVAPRVSENIPTLSFGVYTSDKPSEMYKKFKPMLRYIEDEIAARIEDSPQIKLVIYKTYELALEAFINGEVDFVRFGPASYVIAKNRNPEVRLLAIEENKGKKRFNGIILVREDSSFGSLKDLNGSSFAFGDENSTIGRYLSQAELVEAGLNVTDLESFDYLGRHDRVVAAVLHGKYDAGAAKESTFAKYREKGLRALKSFDNVTKPWVARSNLEEDHFVALQDVLLNTTNPEILKTFSKSLSGFSPCADSEYDFVRQGMERSKRFFPRPAENETANTP